MEDEDEDNAAYRARERLDGPEGMMIFTGFMAAAMASGKSAKGSANEADLAMNELRKRFT